MEGRDKSLHSKARRVLWDVQEGDETSGLRMALHVEECGVLYQAIRDELVAANEGRRSAAQTTRVLNLLRTHLLTTQGSISRDAAPDLSELEAVKAALNEFAPALQSPLVILLLELLRARIRSKSVSSVEVGPFSVPGAVAELQTVRLPVLLASEQDEFPALQQMFRKTLAATFYGMKGIHAGTDEQAEPGVPLQNLAPKESSKVSKNAAVKMSSKNGGETTSRSSLEISGKKDIEAAGPGEKKPSSSLPNGIAIQVNGVPESGLPAVKESPWSAASSISPLFRSVQGGWLVLEGEDPLRRRRERSKRSLPGPADEEFKECALELTDAEADAVVSAAFGDSTEARDRAMPVLLRLAVDLYSQESADSAQALLSYGLAQLGRRSAEDAYTWAANVALHASQVELPGDPLRGLHDSLFEAVVALASRTVEAEESAAGEISAAIRCILFFAHAAGHVHWKRIQSVPRALWALALEHLEGPAEADVLCVVVRLLALLQPPCTEREVLALVQLAHAYGADDALRAEALAVAMASKIGPNSVALVSSTGLLPLLPRLRFAVLGLGTDGASTSDSKAVSKLLLAHLRGLGSRRGLRRLCDTVARICESVDHCDHVSLSAARALKARGVAVDLIARIPEDSRLPLWQSMLETDGKGSTLTASPPLTVHALQTALEALAWRARSAPSYESSSHDCERAIGVVCNEALGLFRKDPVGLACVWAQVLRLAGRPRKRVNGSQISLGAVVLREALVGSLDVRLLRLVAARCGAVRGLETLAESAVLVLVHKLDLEGPGSPILPSLTESTSEAVAHWAAVAALRAWERASPAEYQALCAQLIQSASRARDNALLSNPLAQFRALCRLAGKPSSM